LIYYNIFYFTCLTGFAIPTKIPIITPLLPILNRIKKKNLNLESSFGVKKDDYDSGTDLTSGVVKLSSVTLSRHRTESSGYDSIVRDSETNSITSNSSRQSNTFEENYSNI
jgi:kinesin family protein 26